MANKLRGEVKLTLGKTAYVLRPTFEAMCEIEDHLDMPIPQVLRKLVLGDIRIGWVARIVYAGIIAGLDDGEEMPSLSEIGNEIRRTGVANVINYGANDKQAGAISMFLSYGIMGDVDVEKKLAEIVDAQSESEKGKKSTP
jgi:hypothetical protein